MMDLLIKEQCSSRSHIREKITSKNVGAERKQADIFPGNHASQPVRGAGAYSRIGSKKCPE